MLKRGIVVAALLVGCAIGVGVREVVFPVRAAPGARYGYRTVASRDLIATVKARNPAFKDADGASALAEGMSDFGRNGWRYAGCLPSGTLGWGSTLCDTLLFESADGDDSPPPARANLPTPPPPSTTGIHH